MFDIIIVQELFINIHQVFLNYDLITISCSLIDAKPNVNTFMFID